MKKASISIAATSIAVAGCATSVDLSGLRSEKCNSPAAYTSAIARLTNSMPTPLKLTSALSSTLSTNSAPPPITKRNIATGSTLLSTPGATVSFPDLSGGPVLGGAGPRVSLVNAMSLVNNAEWKVINSESEVSDQDLQNAVDARSQIHDLLSSSPLSASNFISDTGSVKAPLTTISSSNASSIGKISKTLQSGGYDNLTSASAAQLNNVESLPLSDAQKNYLAQELLTARFLAAYYKAYFRGGHILQISVDTKSLLDSGATSIESRVDKALADAAHVKNLTSAQQSEVTNVFSSLKKDLGNELNNVSAGLCNGTTTPASGVCLLTQPLGSVSFVTRAGTAIQFAGETVTIGDNGKFKPTISKISSSVVGPQLSQVLWEAVFDSVPPFVPATANSTACVANLYQGTLCIDKTTSQAMLDEINTVDADATNAETATSSIAGYIIRGGWLFSLNNEAVAEVIETSAGEIARKTTEKLVWTHLNSACANQPVKPTVSTAKDF